MALALPLAHETWFDHGGYPTDWGFAGETATVELLAGAVVLTLVVRHIATRRDGVDKVYAMQAGREIRVMVEPNALDDDGAVLLSHEIAREIEDQLEYPGQVKVTVIRESRAVEYAK